MTKSKLLLVCRGLQGFWLLGLGFRVLDHSRSRDWAAAQACDVAVQAAVAVQTV